MGFNEKKAAALKGSDKAPHSNLTATQRLSSSSNSDQPLISSLGSSLQDYSPMSSIDGSSSEGPPNEGPSAPKVPTNKAWDADLDFHQSLFDTAIPATSGRSVLQGVHTEEIRTTPLFSARVLENVAQFDRLAFPEILPQYGLIAKVLEEYSDQDAGQLHGRSKYPPGPSDLGTGEETRRSSHFDLSSLSIHQPDNRLFLNINAPWSAFICGSQGSGKSHTLSCMLESALQPSQLGPLNAPLAGMVFHYDKFTGFRSSQICEAAYLCSTGIPVKVLVSPSNFHRMKQVYGNLPGLPKGVKPVVVPLFLQESQLNVERMMKLMAIEDDGRATLYMEVVCRILRSMALRNPDRAGLDYQEFKRRIELENFNPAQAAMVSMRFGLLESFMYWPAAATPSRNEIKPSFDTSRKGKLDEREWEDKQDQSQRARLGKATTWSFKPGSLTIIDLSCPFVDESAACAMFNICLALFLEDRAHTGRIIALDEAHKFMTGTDSGNVFTESLLSVIRQQRHLATRVIVATQEPTISPALLDLSSMTIVHRFTSPEWLKALSSHLAGVKGEIDGAEGEKRNLQRIMKMIVTLEAGQALLFSPNAMLRPATGHALKMEKLGPQYVKIRVRKRLTADGGRSVLAT